LEGWFKASTRDKAFVDNTAVNNRATYAWITRGRTMNNNKSINCPSISLFTEISFRLDLFTRSNSIRLMNTGVEIWAPYTKEVHKANMKSRSIMQE